jgi:predicted nucleic acid-binding protein
VKEYFADSFCFLALNNPRDEAHERARAAMEGRAGLVVTTPWVLTEVGDALAAPGNRRQFIELLDLLASAPNVIVVPASDSLYHAGVALRPAAPGPRMVSD